MTFQHFTVEFDRETDGRWIADVPAIPGCLAYDATREAALAAVRKLAEAVVAERVTERPVIPAKAGTQPLCRGETSDQPKRVRPGMVVAAHDTAACPHLGEVDRT